MEDRSRLSMRFSEMNWSQCSYCKHLQPDGSCATFPWGIPDEITFNWHNHRQPYPGDNGIQFEALEGYENVEITPFPPSKKS